MERARSSQTPLQPPRSLVLASMDIGRVLADCDGLTFRAQGTCLAPDVQDGDLLFASWRLSPRAEPS